MPKFKSFSSILNYYQDRFEGMAPSVDYQTAVLGVLSNPDDAEAVNAVKQWDEVAEMVNLPQSVKQELLALMQEERNKAIMWAGGTSKQEKVEKVFGKMEQKQNDSFSLLPDKQAKEVVAEIERNLPLVAADVVTSRYRLYTKDFVDKAELYQSVINQISEETQKGLDWLTNGPCGRCGEDSDCISMYQVKCSHNDERERVNNQLEKLKELESNMLKGFAPNAQELYHEREGLYSYSPQLQEFMQCGSVLGMERNPVAKKIDPIVLVQMLTRSEDVFCAYPTEQYVKREVTNEVEQLLPYVECVLEDHMKEPKSAEDKWLKDVYRLLLQEIEVSAEHVRMASVQVLQEIHGERGV